MAKNPSSKGMSRKGYWYCKNCNKTKAQVTKREFVRIRGKRICVVCGKKND
jgi:hypothetical protein